jgi:broad specificity phosphatase PhoE
LYLMLHADYRWEKVDGIYGDRGLSAEGIAQAEKLRERLAQSGEIKPDVLIASTQRGAFETAQMIAPALGVPVTPDPDFEEWRSEDGTLEPDEFMRQWNALTKAQKPYYRWVEGCENRLEFGLRVTLAMNRVLQAQAGKTIVVVSHGAFIQLSFGYFFGYGEASIERAGFEVARTSITHWYKADDSDRWTLERSNDCHHSG